MNKCFLYSALSALLMSCEMNGANQDVSIVERPHVTTINPDYTNNRNSLLPMHFIKLPVGSIVPKGWLGNYLELQKNGLTGHLGEISAWLEKENNAWIYKEGNHG